MDTRDDGWATLADEGSSAAVVAQCFADALDAIQALIVYRSDPPVEICSRPAADDPGNGELVKLRDDFLPSLHGSEKATFSINQRDPGQPSAGAWYAVGASFVTPEGISGAIGVHLAEPPSRPLQTCVAIARAYAGPAALCANQLDGIALALGSSRIDPLTRCLRMGAMADVIDAEINRSERLGHSLSCCFIDLDGFKAVNDNEGHLAGNRVLAIAGDLLTTGARRYDHVARFGGDEFLVLLPETPLRDAKGFAGRLCQQLASGIAEGTGMKITASAGVAEWQYGRPAEQMIEAADLALRDAKANGGSRVSVDPGSAELRTFEPLQAATSIIKMRYAKARRPTDERIRELMRTHQITEAQAILLAAGRLHPPEQDAKY